MAASGDTYPTMALDSFGRLLVATDRGLARRTARGWETVAVDDGLGESDLSSILRDREGNIWIGLLGSGLARWVGYNEWQSWTDREGLSRSSIWAIAQDAEGSFWVGTPNGLSFGRAEGGHLVWKHQPVAGFDIVRTIVRAADGELWIGGEAGIARRDARTRSWVRIDAGLPGGVQHLMSDHQGRIWASTRQGLFRTVEPVRASGKVRFTQMVPPGSNSSERFVMTAEDPNGGIWAAGDLGLSRLTGDRWVRYTAADGLPDRMVAQVAAAPDGSVWIGYRDAFGVTHLTPGVNGVKTEQFGAANGLRSGKSIFLGFDRRGWLWVGTDHGVDVFDKAIWRHFGRADGLIWDDCNTNAFLAAEDGSVWVGTSRGLSRFEPQPVPQRGVPPRVVFTSVTSGEIPLDPAAELELPWNRRSLQVRFAALTFADESSVVFRYRLGGEAGEWQETKEGELSFPALPPRYFTLEVMARSGQGLWSAPARLSFRVLRPWWGSPWLSGALILAIVAMARLTWRRRVRRLEAERKALEHAIWERTHELAAAKARAEQETEIVDRQKREIQHLLDQAKEVSRHKSEFLANMSHEIRTPMNGVLGMTNLVLETELTDEQRENLETARLSANSLLTLLNDILDFSKIEAGRLELSPVEFSLAECLDQAGKMFALQLSSKNLEYSVSVGGDIPGRMLGDPDRLRQILVNLLNNAIKFTEKGGICVSVRRESSTDDVALLFSVRDSGIGIPLEKQQLIFDAFRQADGSTTRKYGGTGLGLAICSRLVNLMGGSIWVESEPGLGSTFYFRARFGMLPEEIRNVEPSRQHAAASPSAPSAQLNILLAEDNPVNQRLASKILERRGHRVAIAATGRDAHECVQREEFDVVLMDVQMPDMDGLEATRLIREWEKPHARRTPIIAVTAHSMRGDRERCLMAGMDGYITKPFEAALLIEAVEAIAGLRGQQIPAVIPA